MRANEFLVEFDPTGYDQYKLYVGDGIQSHFVDKFSSLETAKEELKFLWNSDPQTRLVVWLIKDLNDKVVYYYDPQENAEAPKQDNLDEMSTEIHGGIRTALKQKGYKYINSGVDKQVWRDPNTDQVLIIFGTGKGIKGWDFTMEQRMFLNWINYCNKNQNNKNLPKFSGVESFKFRGQPYLQARMEPLQEITGDKRTLVRWLDRYITPAGKKLDFNVLLRQLISTFNQLEAYEIADAKKIIQMLGGKRNAFNLMQTVKNVSKFAMKYGYHLDLHSGNYMQRNDGTIVVNDPWVIFNRRP
jgi:hypothetical protein